MLSKSRRPDRETGQRIETNEFYWLIASPNAAYEYD